MDAIDTQVQQLLEKIATERAALASDAYAPARASWKTNGSLCLFPGAQPVNIITASLETIELLSHHLSLISSSGCLHHLHGSPLSHWIQDCHKRKITIQLKDKQAHLAKLEIAAKNLQSPDLRRAQELQSLQQLLDSNPPNPA